MLDKRLLLCCLKGVHFFLSLVPGFVLSQQDVARLLILVSAVSLANDPPTPRWPSESLVVGVPKDTWLYSTKNTCATETIPIKL